MRASFNVGRTGAAFGLAFILFVGSALGAWADEDNPQTFTIIRVHLSGAGDATPHHLGDTLKVGDHLVTGPGEEIQLEAGDHSKILVTENSEITLSANDNAVQTVDLNHGKMVGMAVKQSPSSKHKKTYRFLIRTQTAVMGVRGTEFVAESDATTGHSTLYVLDGVVDVANSVSDLLQHNFVVAQAGQLVGTAGDGIDLVVSGTKAVTQKTTDLVESGVHGVSSAMPFDVIGFLSDFNRTLPDEFHIPLIAGEPRPGDKTYDPRYHLSNFELYSQGYFDKTGLPAGRQSYGYGLSWNPTLRLQEHVWDLRFHIGAPRLFRGDPDRWDDWEFKVSVTRVFRKLWFVEAGPLLQIYHAGQGGFGLSASGGIWFGDRPLLRILERVFVGANAVDSPFPAWEYRFGIGARVF